jgi:hypothetical protein
MRSANHTILRQMDTHHTLKAATHIILACHTTCRQLLLGLHLALLNPDFHLVWHAMRMLPHLRHLMQPLSTLLRMHLLGQEVVLQVIHLHQVDPHGHIQCPVRQHRQPAQPVHPDSTACCILHLRHNLTAEPLHPALTPVHMAAVPVRMLKRLHDPTLRSLPPKDKHLRTAQLKHPHHHTHNLPTALHHRVHQTTGLLPTHLVAILWQLIRI